MAGYHEPSTGERIKDAIRRGLLGVGRIVGEVLLFGLLVGWTVFWGQVAWAVYRLGHPLQVVPLVGVMVAPLIGWYLWRALGELPVERPDLTETPRPTSS